MGARHIVIYGPPAAGKRTVASVLAERFGLLLLDNHLTVDVAVRLFPFGSREMGALVERLRVVLFEAAAEAGRDAVSTFVYGHPVDRGYVGRMHEHASRLGVALHWVMLRPPPGVLEERVVGPSRSVAGKIRDVETLRRLLARWDVYTPIEQDDLQIDNGELEPSAAAALIAAHVGLADPGRSTLTS